MGHSSSVFLSTTLGKDDGNNYARVMAVRQHRIPFDQWVKNIVYNGCGKKGHIGKDCPDKKKEYDKTTTSYSDRRGNDHRGNDRLGNDRRGNNNDRRGKREAKFKKAFQIAMYAIGEASDGEDNKSLAANVLASDSDSDTDESSSDESLAAHAACMFSSLSKE